MIQGTNNEPVEKGTSVVVKLDSSTESVLQMCMILNG